MALVAMLTFLEINGYTVSATDPQLAHCSLRSAAVKNIYTINADGTDLTQVSNGGTDGPADWGTHPLAS
jgi:prophage maintenance system killer protein